MGHLMETRTTETITSISEAELREALRPAMSECGIDVNKLSFEVSPDETIKVASNFDLSSPSVGTLADVIRDMPPLNKYIPRYLLQAWIAVLTDEALYGDKAWPKTDYHLL